MNKKYELTDETLMWNGYVLHRIVALRDFGDVKKGDKGGWVESEKNLSQRWYCWVADEAIVFGDAEVHEDAQVYGYARVYDNAIVSDEAQVYGKAKVYGEAVVLDKAEVCDEAQVYGNADVSGEAHVGGYALVSGEAEVFGKARVFGEARGGDNVHVTANAKLCTGMTKKNDDYIVVGPQGSRHSFATYHIPSDTVCTGCFVGSLKEFEAAVEYTHKDNAWYLRQYKLAIYLFNAYKSNGGADLSEVKHHSNLTDANMKGTKR